MEQVDYEYEIVIEPRRSWLRVDWRGLWEFRDLLYLLVRRDFVSKYKQTILGPLWFVLQPLLMTLVFTVIFGKVAKIPTDSIPPVLFYLCGLLVWGYFSQTLSLNSNVFVANMNLFGKVYFPRLIIPLANCVSNLFAFGIQLLTFLAFYAYFKLASPSGGLFAPQWTLLLLPLLLLQAGLLALGTGLWLSALTAKYRDFSHLTNLLVQMWMYATPIIYPLSSIPEKWRWVAALNPMAPIVEAFKYSFFGRGEMIWAWIFASASVTVVLTGTGILVFKWVERTFVDSV